jgi:hypothetical protein
MLSPVSIHAALTLARAVKQLNLADAVSIEPSAGAERALDVRV